jgi:hypothetical protein
LRCIFLGWSSEQIVKTKLVSAALSLILVVATAHQAGAEAQFFGNKWARVHRPKKSAPLPAFEKGEPYSALRGRLVNSGWRPASDADADQCTKGDGRCEGRPEMQSCAGTGEANCLFLWQKASTLIAVSTIYDPPVAEAVECRAHCRKPKAR